MKTQIFLVSFGLLLIVGLVNAQKTLQQPSGDLVLPPTPITIDQTKNQIIIDDPFAKKTSPEHHKKRHPRNDHEGFPQNGDAEEIWQTYKPFVYDDEEEKEQNQHKSRVNAGQFNELLKWGMLAGSAFLVFVLVKTCTKKRGRRQMRRTMQEAQRRQALAQPSQNVYFYHPQQQPQVQPFVNPILKESEEVLDDKILQAEKQLIRLREIKQQALRQQFNRKKLQEEQKRIEMVNIQRKQPFQQQARQNNWNVGYGPVVYGQQNVHFTQHQIQQPFHIQGIEPIRQRSNSFKTEVSEQPILNNQIKYRNGIPIGKPLRQNDNDSSFASEYPEV